VTAFVASAEDAVATIQSGQSVWVHSMAASPVLLLRALAKRALELQDLTVMQMHLEHAEALADPALYGRLRNRAFFASASTRDLINRGLADYVPVFLSEIPRLFRQDHQPVDVALVQVSPPDRHGYCSLGVSVEVTRAACDVARKIIAHINPNMPRSHGDSHLALSDIDVAFEQSADIIEHAPETITPEVAAIGRHVAELVRDGDCLQLGIGAVPDAVLACLGNHQHLGIHTEMFSDGLLPLLESGVVDNSRKKIHPGKVVATFVMGTRKLYDFVDDNPLIRMLDVEYVNNIATIRKNRQMVSINSAIQVDLTGQVCADSIGSRIYSGVGGQLDFVLGAQLADEGRSIIALPSTAAGGTVSRIVPFLTQGAGVVTTRAHVDYIATEYGVVRLKGRSLRERAAALNAIAHPAFRDTLQAHTLDRGH
jgi:acyl-CoA hydrolase